MHHMAGRATSLQEDPRALLYLQYLLVTAPAFAPTTLAKPSGHCILNVSSI
jgi:hypothetical protein